MSNSSFRRDYGLILVGAVIFTASLLWRDFFVDVKNKYFPHTHKITDRFIYTVLVTMILIYVTIYLRNFFKLNSTPPVDNNPDNSNADNNSNINLQYSHNQNTDIINHQMLPDGFIGNI